MLTGGVGAGLVGDESDLLALDLRVSRIAQHVDPQTHLSASVGQEARMSAAKQRPKSNSAHAEEPRAKSARPQRGKKTRGLKNSDFWLFSSSFGGLADFARGFLRPCDLEKTLAFAFYGGRPYPAPSFMTDAASDPGQTLLVGLPGPELDADTAAMLRRVQPGGYILFTRNIDLPRRSAKTHRRPARSLSKRRAHHHHRPGRRPGVALEGHRQRTARRDPAPPAQRPRARAPPRRTHRAVAAACSGSTSTSAPCSTCACTATRAVDNSLRGRCYGETVEQVVRLAGAFNSELRTGGVLSCGKHFPGYTSAREDAHHSLPVIERTRDELDAVELGPFREMVNVLDSVMVCHAYYPCLDLDGRAARHRCLARSSTGLLREELDFRGLVMTDDLDMGAILNTYGLEETLHLALAAGADLTMICHRVDQLENARRFVGKRP